MYTWMFFVWSPPPHVTPSISAAQFTPRLAPEPSAGSVIYLVSSLSSGAALINAPDLTLHTSASNESYPKVCNLGEIALRTQFHVERTWGQRLFSIVS